MKQTPHLKKWRIIFAVYTLAILMILYFAYNRGLPTFIGRVPYYDLIGHFFLYGMWGYLIYRSFNRNLFGPAILTGITILEELAQGLSVNRTLSLTDLFFSLLGIWIVVFLDRLFRVKSINLNQK